MKYTAYILGQDIICNTRDFVCVSGPADLMPMECHYRKFKPLYYKQAIKNILYNNAKDMINELSDDFDENNHIYHTDINGNCIKSKNINDAIRAHYIAALASLVIDVPGHFTWKDFYRKDEHNLIESIDKQYILPKYYRYDFTLKGVINNSTGYAKKICNSYVFDMPNGIYLGCNIPNDAVLRMMNKRLYTTTVKNKAVLVAECVAFCSRKLTDDELEEVEEEFQDTLVGQYSDGWGENIIYTCDDDVYATAPYTVDCKLKGKPREVDRNCVFINSEDIPESLKELNIDTLDNKKLENLVYNLYYSKRNQYGWEYSIERQNNIKMVKAWSTPRIPDIITYMSKHADIV